MKFNFPMDKLNLLNKIHSAKFEVSPFQHIIIENFLDKNFFKKIITSKQINTSVDEESDLKLINHLREKGYEVIPFPGTLANQEEYINWRKSKKTENDGLCEGIGLTLRLSKKIESELQDLLKFFEGPEFTNAVLKKFNYNFQNREFYHDGGIQKYLSDYEISPHPDVRKKFLTWMLNINPMSNSQELNIHTHYLSLIKKFSYISEFFKNNREIDRCWVPWDWCETIFKQDKNNSLVIFSPSDDTFHAVKAVYDHFEGQRTQLYGNLWYDTSEATYTTQWSDLDITNKLITKAKERKNNFL